MVLYGGIPSPAGSEAGAPDPRILHSQAAVRVQRPHTGTEQLSITVLYVRRERLSSRGPERLLKEECLYPLSSSIPPSCAAAAPESAP